MMELDEWIMLLIWVATLLLSIPLVFLLVSKKPNWITEIASSLSISFLIDILVLWNTVLLPLGLLFLYLSVHNIIDIAHGVTMKYREGIQAEIYASINHSNSELNTNPTDKRPTPKS